jgi:hypothetical protein
MLLDLEKLLVKRKDLGWTSGTRRRKTACGMRQNLLQMMGRSHREFGLLFNLKLDLQNPNPSQTEKKRSLGEDCFTLATRPYVEPRFSISRMKRPVSARVAYGHEEIPTQSETVLRRGAPPLCE